MRVRVRVRVRVRDRVRVAQVDLARGLALVEGRLQLGDRALLLRSGRLS